MKSRGVQAKWECGGRVKAESTTRQWSRGSAYRRGPWRWACCQTWPRHCNDKKRWPGYAACSSSSLNLRWAVSVAKSLPKQNWEAVPSHKIHTCGWRYSERDDRRVRLSLRFRTYGPVGQCENGRVEVGERGEVVEVRGGWSQEPWLSKQSVNRAALCPGSLTRTTFCILG